MHYYYSKHMPLCQECKQSDLQRNHEEELVNNLLGFEHYLFSLLGKLASPQMVIGMLVVAGNY